MLAIQLASQHSTLPARRAAIPPSSSAPILSVGLDTVPAPEAGPALETDGDSQRHGRNPSRPVTWLFVGDSFLPQDCESRDWPGFVELFTAGLRSRRPPANDPVVDACTHGFRVRDVLHGFSERIGRRNPSVIFLLCGADDPAAGMQALPGFESALLQFARRAHDAGIRLMLNTSPVPYLADDHPSAVAHLVYAEAVRNIAAEVELPLVDHRREWEQFAIPPEQPGSWFDTTGRYPGALGHRRIASRLLSALAEVKFDLPDEVTSLAAMSE